MLVSELIGKVHTSYKGKAAEKAPAVGTPKYNVYLSLINNKIRGWANNSNYDWNSLFTIKTDDITTLPYLLPADYIRLSDHITLIDSNSNKLKLPLIDARNREDGNQAAYVAGFGPKELYFTAEVPAAFATGNIEFGYFAMPPTLVNGTDEVICDSYEWLEYAVAAELARNDPAKDDQFANLIGLAQTEFTIMAQNAMKKPYGSKFKVKNNHPRLGRSW